MNQTFTRTSNQMGKSDIHKDIHTDIHNTGQYVPH